MLFRKGVRIELTDLRKNGQRVEVRTMSNSGNIVPFETDLDQVCRDMFNSSYRSARYDISGTSYGFTERQTSAGAGRLLQIGCLFSEKP